DLRPPSEHAAFLAIVGTGAGDGRNGRLWRHITADGSQRQVDVRVQLIHYHDRPATLATMIDVTARIADEARARAASEALRASDARLHRALVAARMVAWEIDIETGKLSRSSNVQELLGIPYDGPLSNVRIHPDDFAAYAEAKARLLAGEPVSIEYRVQ